jgi:hypothetical protein
VKAKDTAGIPTESPQNLNPIPSRNDTFIRFTRCKMNHLQALKELAESIKASASKVNHYFWRLSGEEPNSFCKFLGMDEGELKAVLRLCKIYNGEKDNFSKNNFELLMSQSNCDWTKYRLNAKVERFIKIGNGGEVTIPKDMYDEDGSLTHYPIEELHVRNMRTKSQKGVLPKLVDFGNKKQASETDMLASKERSKYSKELKQMISPKSLLFSYVEELVTGAGSNGDGTISLRASRKLHRLIVACVDVAAKELLQSALDKYALEKESFVAIDKVSLLSPERVSSSTLVNGIVTPATSVFVDPITEPRDDNVQPLDDSDIDDDSIETSSTSEFLSELKEEVVLQSLLHKRIHEKKE